MTDRAFKLDRLAMHQEWYDKNRTMLFIEASVVMQELLAMCRQYHAERDEARQQLKEAKARNTMYLSKIQEYEAREQ